MINRRELKKNSNNSHNPNKNVCAWAVAKMFGAHNETRYLHTSDDLKRAVRKRYKVRSRLSCLPKGSTVAAYKRKCQQLSIDLECEEIHVLGFIVIVENHALGLRHDGSVYVDTDPRERDRRKVLEFYIVYKETPLGEWFFD